MSPVHKSCDSWQVNLIGFTLKRGHDRKSWRTIALTGLIGYFTPAADAGICSWKEGAVLQPF